MNGVKMKFNSYLEKAQKQLDAADKKTREKAASYAVSEVRKATPKKTGNLRKPLRKKHFRRSSVVGFTEPEGAHAHFVEMGHDLVSNGVKIGHVEARPFFKPTMERIAPTIQKMIVDGYADI
jgi:HK97 gp10 family phage protein